MAIALKRQEAPVSGLATPQIEFIDMPEILRGKYQYFTQADITKLRLTGYERRVTPLPDAVRDYVQNYLATDLRLGA